MRRGSSFTPAALCSHPLALRLKRKKPRSHRGNETPNPVHVYPLSTHLLLVLLHELLHVALLLLALWHLRHLLHTLQAREQGLKRRVEQLKVEGELALEGRKRGGERGGKQWVFSGSHGEE